MAVAMLLACGDGGSEPKPAETALPLVVTGLNIEVARAPADGRPFVAGEEVRIGLRIDGGRPPYTVSTRGVVSAASARLDVAASADAALIGRIDPATAAGMRELILEVADTASSHTTATLPVDILAVAPNDDTGPIRLLDTAGRARTSFHWGESIVVSGRIDGGRARLRMWDDTGREVAGIADLPLSDGVVELPIVIPRFAASGSYGIELDTDSGARARAVLEVTGQTFPPAEELAIDRLVLRGGADGRAPRTGVIRRGELLTVEARVAGATGEVGTTLRARRAGWLDEQAWPPMRPAAFGPTRRFVVTGTWKVPRELPPGRLQLEIEVTTGDHVSAIHRDLLVR